MIEYDGEDLLNKNQKIKDIDELQSSRSESKVEESKHEQSVESNSQVQGMSLFQT